MWTQKQAWTEGRRYEGTETKWRTSSEDKAKTGVMHPQTKDCPGTTRSYRRKAERSLPTASKGASSAHPQPLLILDSGLQSCETVKLCYFKPQFGVLGFGSPRKLTQLMLKKMKICNQYYITQPFQYDQP